MQPSLLRITLLALAASLTHAADEGAVAEQCTAEIKALTAADFEKTVQAAARSLVIFSIGNCEACQKLKPELTAAAATLAEAQVNVPFFTVNCDTDADPALCSRLKVLAYPDIRVFEAGKSMYMYEGEQTSAAIVESMREGGQVAYASEVATVTFDNFAEVVLDETKDVFVELYTPWCAPCKQLTPLWNDLSIQFEEMPTVTVAAMDTTQSVNATMGGTAKKIDSRFKMDSYPRLYFVPAGAVADGPVLEYDGNIDIHAMRQFVLDNGKSSMRIELK